MNTDRFHFKKVFAHTGSTFSACSDAERWLKERGFSIGPMCVPEPRAIMKGDTLLPKWHYVTPEGQLKLDGMATADNWREDDVTVYLTEDPG